MNLIEILRNLPKDKILYSTLIGQCRVVNIGNIYNEYPITVESINTDTQITLTHEGKYYKGFDDAECILFPSKENKDWDTFKQNSCEIKAFDKVLVRDSVTDAWVCDIYSHLINNCFYCVGGIWHYCILYENNKHLLNTTITPERLKF